MAKRPAVLKRMPPECPLRSAHWGGFFLGLLAWLCGGLSVCLGQASFPRPPAAYADSALVAKAFPLLSLLENQAGLRRLVGSNKALRAVARHHAARTHQAFGRDQADAKRYADSLCWKPQEIQVVGNALVNTYSKNIAVRTGLAPLLKETGSYPLYASQTDTAALRLAWRDAALGLNRMLQVYMANQKPRYPAIDSSSFPRQDAVLAQQVRAAMLPLSIGQRRRPTAFYTLPLHAALLALRLNDRHEAVRYEPLKAGLNAAPYAAVASTPWARYPFSAILVPGLGPEQPGVALDTLGAYRCRLAAARYRQGLAPFLVVSGGHVHPNKTPYCEAVEMKKYLIETLGIPEAAVIIEPYARHTTTNLRNTFRLLYAFGIPTDRPLLTVTDPAQSSYILGMAERCRRELGYVPYRDLQKRSPEENTYSAVPEVRQPDPYDPLDP
ncbi:YdcF family protein [Hymenobacter sp. BT188]|uniref:YdcF family protein n=1 Tax=Hymenobacter sp. BT188 TaxID=2763504 RepID=UPI00165122C0|nr:YdcF family protein [Hymenobacter sp. BT188]MBC6608799.1 YdcF family protein [Hymenobacter sp. BT188]